MAVFTAKAKNKVPPMYPTALSDMCFAIYEPPITAMPVAMT